MRILVTDRGGFQESSRVKLENGFLKVSGRAARSGVYQYLASELGITDRDPNDIVNVYRPPQEVFKPESLDSYNGVDVTDDHPTEMVNSKTFKQVSVGHVTSSASQDGDFVSVDMIIKDQDAIDKIESGKVQLSPGYYAEYIKKSGTAEGLNYEYEQADIIVNHVSLVDRGRGGSQVKLFDNQKGGDMPTLTIDGATIELQDAASVALVRKALDEANKKAEDAEEEAKEAKDEAEKMKAEKDKADEDMEKEKEAKDKALDALSVYVSKEVVDSAKKIAGDKFTCDSKDPLEIKRSALSIVRPKVDWADKSNLYVEAAYDMEKEKMEDEDEKKDEDKTKANDSYKGLAKDMSAKDSQPKPDAFTSYRTQFADAWKQTVSQEK